MIHFLLFLLTLTIQLIVINSECPKVNDFPVMHPSMPEKFLCAVGYYGVGHELAVNGL
jgi:hypothetical protein